MWWAFFFSSFCFCLIFFPCASPCLLQNITINQPQSLITFSFATMDTAPWLYISISQSNLRVASLLLNLTSVTSSIPCTVYMSSPTAYMAQCIDWEPFWQPETLSYPWFYLVNSGPLGHLCTSAPPNSELGKPPLVSNVLSPLVPLHSFL